MSVEDVLSNNCINNVRTGDLTKTNRKFILLRLLMKLLVSVDFQEILSTSCCAALAVPEREEEEQAASIINLTDDDGKEQQGSSLAKEATVFDDSDDDELPENKKGVKG